MSKQQTTIGSLVFVKVRSVTRPLLKMDDVGGKAIYVTVQSAVKDAKPQSGGKTEAPLLENGQPNPKYMAPPRLLDVLNLETGEEMTIIANKVLETELQETYPGDGYVGKSFEIVKHKSDAGKRYATFGIAEIQLAEPEVEEKKPDSKKPDSKK